VDDNRSRGERIVEWIQMAVGAAAFVAMIVLVIVDL
jgi:hypothetical protein